MTYNKITSDEFSEMIYRIAKENINQTLSLPGIYEVISEEFNNEALERIVEEKTEARREHLRLVIANIALYGFLCYQAAPFNGETKLISKGELNHQRARARR